MLPVQYGKIYPLPRYVKYTVPYMINASTGNTNYYARDIHVIHVVHVIRVVLVIEGWFSLLAHVVHVVHAVQVGIDVRCYYADDVIYQSGYPRLRTKVS